MKTLYNLFILYRNHKFLLSIIIILFMPLLIGVLAYNEALRLVKDDMQ